MQFKKLTLSLLSLLMACYSVPSHAFKVDKMVLVGDQRGNGIITITNDESRPLFINTEIDEITIENGVDVKKTPYTRENVADWKISLTYQKLVLSPGEEKDIGIRSLCHNTTCDESKDLMFMLSFVPSTYKEQSESNQSAVEVNYGFSPVYIIPTTKPEMDYDIINNGDKLVVNNRSNTLIEVFIDSCDSKVTKQCRQKFTVLSGRNKAFRLLETVQRDELNVIVNSHDSRYSKTDVIKRSK